MKFLLLTLIAHRPDPATGGEKIVAERLQCEVASLSPRSSRGEASERGSDMIFFTYPTNQEGADA